MAMTKKNYEGSKRKKKIIQEKMLWRIKMKKKKNHFYKSRLSTQDFSDLIIFIKMVIRHTTSPIYINNLI